MLRFVRCAKTHFTFPCFLYAIIVDECHRCSGKKIVAAETKKLKKEQTLVQDQIDALTSIIDRSCYDEDIWLQRGCQLSGMDKFFGIDMSDFSLPEAELAAKLLGTEPTEYAFIEYIDKQMRK